MSGIIGFLKGIENEIKAAIGLNTTAIDKILDPLRFKGKLSIGNITVSGTRGVLTKIQIQDSTTASTPFPFDATISINIDGAGAVVLSLNTMYRAKGAIDSMSNALTVVSDSDASMTLQLNLPFQTSLDVTITGDDGHAIFWNEEV